MEVELNAVYQILTPEGEVQIMYGKQCHGGTVS